MSLVVLHVAVEARVAFLIVTVIAGEIFILVLLVAVEVRFLLNFGRRRDDRGSKFIYLCCPWLLKLFVFVESLVALMTAMVTAGPFF